MLIQASVALGHICIYLGVYGEKLWWLRSLGENRSNLRSRKSTLWRFADRTTPYNRPSYKSYSQMVLGPNNLSPNGDWTVRVKKLLFRNSSPEIAIFFIVFLYDSLS